MKKHLSIFAFAVMALVCLSSCSGDDNDTPSAPSTTGVAKRNGNINVKWVQLWEKGPKFAEYNVGAANNTAEDYGGYYAWGGTLDKVDDQNTGTEVLTGNNDTATKLWGSKWRMPTQEELEALLVMCDIERTIIGVVKGYKFIGKGDYASNSVFLPAAGSCYDGTVYGQGNYDGNYWSSTPDGSDIAYRLDFRSSAQLVSLGYRYYGFSVRAVLAE